MSGNELIHNIEDIDDFVRGLPLSDFNVFVEYHEYSDWLFFELMEENGLKFYKTENINYQRRNIMQRNIKNAILTIFGIVAIFGFGGVFAYDKICVDQEAQTIRDLKARGALSIADQDKLKALPALEAEEAKRCAFLRSLTPSDEARIAEEKRIGNEEHLKEVESLRNAGLLDKDSLHQTDTGIKDIDPVLSSNAFRQINAWEGYLDGLIFVVAAGGDYNDPKKGGVVVLKGGFGGSREIYNTAIMTGPLEIVSENNGVLTLRSVSGDYEVYHESSDTREKIKTPGGAIYLFNIRTRTFQ